MKPTYILSGKKIFTVIVIFLGLGVIPFLQNSIEITWLMCSILAVVSLFILIPYFIRLFGVAHLLLLAAFALGFIVITIFVYATHFAEVTTFAITLYILYLLVMVVIRLIPSIYHSILILNNGTFLVPVRIGSSWYLESYFDAYVCSENFLNGPLEIAMSFDTKDLAYEYALHIHEKVLY